LYFSPCSTSRLPESNPQQKGVSLRGKQRRFSHLDHPHAGSMQNTLHENLYHSVPQHHAWFNAFYKVGNPEGHSNYFKPRESTKQTVAAHMDVSRMSFIPLSFPASILLVCDPILLPRF
jgi:hypothetical protein